MRSIVSELYHKNKQDRKRTRSICYCLSIASLATLIWVNSAIKLEREGKLIRIFLTIACLPCSIYSAVKLSDLIGDDEANSIVSEGRLDFIDRGIQQLVNNEIANGVSHQSLSSAPIPVVNHHQDNLPESSNQVASEVRIANNDPRKKELWERINQPEYGFLVQLLECKPLLICGPQGSGKTAFAGFLALLRKIFLNHQLEICDPHAHLNSFKWPKCFNVYGSNMNYQAINQRLGAFYDRIKHPKKQGQTTIFDEVTNYSKRCNKDLAEGLLGALLSDCRKPPEYPIVLSHGTTLTSLGGSKGTSKMSEEGLIKVLLNVTRNQTGVPGPAFKGTIIGLIYDDQNNPLPMPIQTETWMHPTAILAIFPELNQVSSGKNSHVSMPEDSSESEDFDDDYPTQLPPINPIDQFQKKHENNAYLIIREFILSQDEITVRDCLGIVDNLTDKGVLFLFEKMAKEGLGKVEIDSHTISNSKFTRSTDSLPTDKGNDGKITKNQSSVDQSSVNQSSSDQSSVNENTTFSNLFGTFFNKTQNNDDDVDSKMICDCGGRYVRNGKHTNGKQKIICKSCRSSRVLDDDDDSDKITIDIWPIM